MGFTKILLSFGLLLIVQVALANTTGTEGKKNNPDKKQEQQQQTGEQSNQQEPEDSPSLEGENEVQITSDSLEDDSVSKYNFIFYFLYKFKYDQAEAAI